MDDTVSLSCRYAAKAIEPAPRSHYVSRAHVRLDILVAVVVGVFGVPSAIAEFPRVRYISGWSSGSLCLGYSLRLWSSLRARFFDASKRSCLAMTTRSSSPRNEYD